MNNIIESINSKINSYLAKRTPYNNEFISYLTKIFINCKNVGENIIRHDYVSRTLIHLIKKYKLNDTPKQITYKKYINEILLLLKNMRIIQKIIIQSN